MIARLAIVLSLLLVGACGKRSSENAAPQQGPTPRAATVIDAPKAAPAGASEKVSGCGLFDGDYLDVVVRHAKWPVEITAFDVVVLDASGGIQESLNPAPLKYELLKEKGLGGLIKQSDPLFKQAQSAVAEYYARGGEEFSEEAQEMHEGWDRVLEQREKLLQNNHNMLFGLGMRFRVKMPPARVLCSIVPSGETGPVYGTFEVLPLAENTIPERKFLSFERRGDGVTYDFEFDDKVYYNGVEYAAVVSLSDNGEVTWQGPPLTSHKSRKVYMPYRMMKSPPANPDTVEYALKVVDCFGHSIILQEEKKK